MALRAATWLAIAIGGTGGTLAALAGSGSAPAPTPVAPARPSAAIAAAKPAQNSASTPRQENTAPAPSSESTGNGPAANSSSAAAASGAVQASRVPLPEAETLPLPSTKQALLRAEMRCDQHKAESCIVAARSYESGSAGATDADKAAKYRRIALTAWISQCDHNSPLACATLATMYRAGSGVPQSERNADALVARARELCRFNQVPICRDLPEH